MRPRDAATLIVIRDGREVLLGRRSDAHVFMPGRYVFPGGAVDRGDARVGVTRELHPPVLEKLERGCSPARARGLAMAAVRETWEETGLILGHPTPQAQRSRSPQWRGFFDAGYEPALDRVDYVARAITPPGRVRRFDARFFLADARDLHGDITGNGELEQIDFYPLEQVLELPLAKVTRALLQVLEGRLRQPVRGSDRDAIPFFREARGRVQIDEH